MQTNRTLVEAAEFGRDESLNFFDIISILWRGKGILLVVTAFTVGLSLAYLFTAQIWYRAEVQLKPVESREGLSGQMGEIGALATTLAGISLGSNSGAEPIAVSECDTMSFSNIEIHGDAVLINTEDSDATLRALLNKYPDARDIEVVGLGISARTNSDDYTQTARVIKAGKPVAITSSNTSMVR